MKMKIKEIVGKNVKAYREAEGLSTNVLAMKAYIPQEKLEDIEAGKEIINEWWYLLRLSETLGLGEVIKACQVYQKLDSVINQLDEIIKTATDLKAELEKERA